MNQSIFRPTFQFNKQAKRDAQDAKILARHLEEKNDREEARQAAYSSRQRVEAGFREAERSTQKRQEGPTGRAKWEQGGRYQFEASNSDDELEQELDGNLDEIAAISGRLKVLATTAGKEIDAQNKHLDKIGTKVDTLDDKIVMNTQYMKRSESSCVSLCSRIVVPDGSDFLPYSQVEGASCTSCTPDWHQPTHLHLLTLRTHVAILISHHDLLSLYQSSEHVSRLSVFGTRTDPFVYANELVVITKHHVRLYRRHPVLITS